MNGITRQSSFDRELYSREKMQFYPTNTEEVSKIAKLFDYGDKNICVLDPCVGDGKAVMELVSVNGEKRENVHVFAVELDKGRYDTFIRGNTQYCCSLNEDFLSIRCTNGAFTLLFANPPYGVSVDDRSKRIENEFMEKLSNYLAFGGYLVWVVPVGLIRDYEASRKLITRFFEVVDVYKFCEPEYSKFKQIAVILKRHPDSVIREESREILTNAYMNIDTLKTLDDVSEGVYPLRSTSPDEIKVFQGTKLDEPKALNALGSSPMYKHLEKRMAVQQYSFEAGRPPLDLNADQYFMMAAVGRSPVKELEGNIAQRGVTQEVCDVTYEDKGGKTYTIETKYSRSTITTIDDYGNIKRLLT